jgi:hypothetical protein
MILFRGVAGAKPMRFWDKSQLMHIWKQRQLPVKAAPLKDGVSRFMKKVVYPRQKKLVSIGQAWRELLPEDLVAHSCLEDIRGGRLTVLVDSAAHLYELNLLIQQGLADQLRQNCTGVSIHEIILRRGVWYRTGEQGQNIPEF